MATTRASKSSKSPKLAPTNGPQVCRWIERFLVHGEGDYFGKPFKLTRDQKAFIYRCYELREDGKRRYRRVLKGLPKGNGKTELAAAIACAELAGPVAPTSPLIPVAAASFEQANLVFAAAKTMLGEGPLADFFEIYDTEIMRRDGPGRMYRVAAAVGTNDGGRPTFFVADEVHEWTGSKERVHLVLANGLAKRKNSWELDISTSGYDTESLLGQMYAYGKRVQSGEINDPTFLFEWLEADEDADLSTDEGLRKAILSCNPAIEAGFLELDSVVRRYNEIPEFEFRRYYLNQWTPASDAWLPPGAWMACKGEVEIEPGDDVYVGIDLGAKHDSSAVVEIGQFGNEFHIRAHVFALWADRSKPPPQAHHVIEGEEIPIVAVENKVREIAARQNVIEVLFDPWRFQRSAELLSEEGLTVLAIPQNNERMSPASQALYDAVIERRLVHDGDPVLAGHIEAAVARDTARGWRLDKTKSRKHSDASIALAIALDRAQSEANTGRPRAFSL